MRILWPQFFAEPETATPCLIERMGPECSVGTNASISHHFEQGTLVEKLPYARLPALFVHGELDPLPPESSTRTAALIPGATVEIIAGSGHFPWLERPGELRGAVERVSSI